VSHSHGKGHGRGWRRHRDFWRAWREEQRRVREEESGEDWEPGCSPPEMMHAWREFFHGFMGAWPERHWAFGGRRFRPWHQGMASFNPFVASLLSKGGGLLPLYVLHLLAEGPRYGNEIMALLAERTGGMWVANPGAIYPLMMLLEGQGLVEGQWEDPHKRTIRIYSLTEAGKVELPRLKAIVRPKLMEALDVLQGLVGDLNGEESETGEEQTPE
jgi:DNA-binding PadR family transcriptional regulator